MLWVPKVLLETREEFKDKQISIFAIERKAVKKSISCINLDIPCKWLRPAEENIPTIWWEGRHVSHTEPWRKAQAALFLLLSSRGVCSQFLQLLGVSSGKEK